MRFAVVSVSMVSLIVTAMLFLADYAAWVNAQELAYEIAVRDYRIVLADCGGDLVCSQPPPTACRHPSDVIEVHADLGPRRRFPFGTSTAEASLYFDAAANAVDVSALPLCAP